MGIVICEICGKRLCGPPRFTNDDFCEGHAKSPVEAAAKEAESVNEAFMLIIGKADQGMFGEMDAKKMCYEILKVAKEGYELYQKSNPVEQGQEEAWREVIGKIEVEEFKRTKYIDVIKSLTKHYQLIKK